MSLTWRVGGYVMAPTGSWRPPSDPPPADAGVYWRKEGNARPVSRTARVVLVSTSGLTRIVPLGECRFFTGQMDMYCDIEGERITPWTGRGAVTSVIDPVPTVTSSAR